MLQPAKVLPSAHSLSTREATVRHARFRVARVRVLHVQDVDNSASATAASYRLAVHHACTTHVTNAGEDGRVGQVGKLLLQR